MLSSVDIDSGFGTGSLGSVCLRVYRSLWLGCFSLKLKRHALGIPGS